MLIIIKLYFFNINEKFYGIFISRYFLCIYMYINVDIDNNNFYFLIVLYVKLMKYMIYKNNWNYKNNMYVVFFVFYDLLKSIFFFLIISKFKRINIF